MFTGGTIWILTRGHVSVQKTIESATIILSLPELQVMDLSGTAVSGNITSLSGLRKLVSLQLKKTQAGGWREVGLVSASNESSRPGTLVESVSGLAESKAALAFIPIPTWLLQYF